MRILELTLQLALFLISVNLVKVQVAELFLQPAHALLARIELCLCLRHLLLSGLDLAEVPLHYLEAIVVDFGVEGELRQLELVVEVQHIGVKDGRWIHRQM